MTPDQPLPLPAGSSLNVAVAGPDPLRSSIWTIWGRKNKGDVFAAPRAIAGTAKTSLHESGQWQHSITQQEAMKYVLRNQDRHFERWQRPAPFAPGIVRAFAILVPRTELRDHGEDLDGVVVAPDAGPSYSITIEVFLTEPGNSHRIHSETGLEELGSISLPNGGLILVIARPVPRDPYISDLMRRRREAIYASIADGDPYVSRLNTEPGGHNALMHEEQADGTITAIEMSLTEQPEVVRVICGSNTRARGAVMRPPFLRDDF